MHVAGYGQVPSDMGWSIRKIKGFDPRLGVTYQLDDKTVIRAGYGRSFDTGVFGSIFGHVVTQNLPVLASQTINAPTTTGAAFLMDQGPAPYVFPTVPSSGLLPGQGYAVSPKARPVPLHFPTIDAWNLSVQRALSPTVSLTVAYVGNKGTHTLADGDGNNTDPNESALVLPGQFGRNGQTLHWDPSAPSISDPVTGGIAADGGVSNARLLKRYYSGSLAACRDSNYISTAALQTIDGDPNLQPGQCGWTNGISYYGDDQNTEFDAMQINLAKTFTKGLSINANYQWANAFDDQNGYWTWDHNVGHMRDSNVRNQQLVSYGSYDLPFGKGKQFAQNANTLADEIIGGFQISYVVNWSSGLPLSVSYSNFGGNEDCNDNVGGTAAPCRPNTTGKMKTHLSSPNFGSNGKITRTFWTPQSTAGGIFSWPGLDNIGNAGANTYHGPSFFNSDLALTKAFTIHETIATKFRMDAFNAFNHIQAANPGNGDIFGNGTIDGGAGAGGLGFGGMAPGPGPRQLEFSLHVQF
jgi:hypothetical protein